MRSRRHLLALPKQSDHCFIPSPENSSKGRVAQNSNTTDGSMLLFFFNK
jgi:hypothetical protein